MEKALFDWPIVLQYDVKANYQLIRRKFLHVCCLLNQPKATRVCIYSINQSNHYFCSFVVFVLLARFHFKVIQNFYIGIKLACTLVLSSYLTVGLGKPQRDSSDFVTSVSCVPDA